MIYELSFRGPGGSVKAGTLKSYEPSGAVINHDGGLFGYEQIVFLIHGFNVREQAGRVSLSRLAKGLVKENWAVVFVLWPGDSPIGPLSYPFTEGHQANDTAVELARTIEKHVSKATPLHFVAHSLGCRVTLETLLRLWQMANGEKGVFPVRQVVLYAGAVDDYALSIPRKYKTAAERARRVVVLSSVKDNVLKWIYPAGDLLQAFIYFWEETFGFALGYHGPVPIQTARIGAGGMSVKQQQQDIAGNVYPIKINRRYGVGHGDYLPPSQPADPPNAKQTAAENIARNALAGETQLDYRL